MGIYKPGKTEKKRTVGDGGPARRNVGRRKGAKEQGEFSGG